MVGMVWFICCREVYGYKFTIQVYENFRILEIPPSNEWMKFKKLFNDGQQKKLFCWKGVWAPMRQSFLSEGTGNVSDALVK